MRGNKPPPGDWPKLPKHYRYRHSRWWTTVLKTVVLTTALGVGAVGSMYAGYQAGLTKGKTDQRQADQEQADYIASIAAITRIPTTTPSPAPVPGPPVAPVRTPAPVLVRHAVQVCIQSTIVQLTEGGYSWGNCKNDPNVPAGYTVQQLLHYEAQCPSGDQCSFTDLHNGDYVWTDVQPANGGTPSAVSHLLIRIR